MAGNPIIMLRVPPALGKPLARDAAKSRRTVQAVALQILATHFGVEVAEPRRGKPSRSSKRA